MKKMNLVFGTTIAAILFVSILSNSASFAVEQPSISEIVPMGGNIAIEKTTITMSVPQNNNLPWAFVEGKITNPVPNHPVIIQIFDSDNNTVIGNSVGAVHFAQTNVNADGSYEYKFRVLNIENGITENIFQGDYTIKVFKVIYLDPNLDSA